VLLLEEKHMVVLVVLYVHLWVGFVKWV
jgi:hypothetical protein